MAVLKMSDGRVYVLRKLVPKSTWQKDTYGNEQLECNVEVLEPEEFNDGKAHLLYVSRSIFKALEKTGLDRESTYTLQYTLRDGRKVWDVFKGQRAPVQDAPQASENGVDAQEAILAAISLLEAATEFIEVSGRDINAWQLAVVAALLSGGKVKSKQTGINERMNHHELSSEVPPAW